MEFRLSENTVNSYDTYTEERAHYAGPSGADGGNWLDFKQWLIANSFTCSWNNGAVPTKEGNTKLAMGIYNIVRPTMKTQALGGLLYGNDDVTHGNGESGNSCWICGLSDTYPFYDGGGVYSMNILLVRPL